MSSNGILVASIIFIACGSVGAVFLTMFVSQRRTVSNQIRAGRLKYYMVTLPKQDSDFDRKKATEKDFKEVVGKMEQLMAGLYGIIDRKFSAFLTGQEFLGFEIASSNFSDSASGQEIRFYLLTPPKYLDLFSKQITAFYQDANIQEAPEYQLLREGLDAEGVTISLERPYTYPIKTYKQLDADPLNDVVNVIGQLNANEACAIQMLFRPINNSWMTKSHRQARSIREGKSFSLNPFVNFLIGLGGMFQKTDPTKAQKQLTNTEETRMKAIEEKTKKIAFETVIRVIAEAPTREQAQSNLTSLISAFGQFEDPTLNGFRGTISNAGGRGTIAAYQKHNIDGSGHPMILNLEEIASFFHFPHSQYNRTPTLKWLNFKVSPAPANLPQSGILLGNNWFRGVNREIRISEKDRFRHLYIIGQTGMGKSVLQKNMAKQDIAAGNGICVVDPHGDLIDDILEWIPPERANDVILFDPTDTSRPMGLNLLEAKTPEEKDFIALDAMNMMIGLFGPEVFGPRIQDYFRNGCLTLMDDEEEGGAITDIVRLFTDEDWQHYKVSKVKNPIVKSFWTKQMAATGAREKEEMIPFLAAKFGAFVTNSTMRNIVGQTHSAFDFAEVMDQKKILLVKLSKGLIGDINANLLGMIFVNKIQVAAMRRASQTGEARVPFFLYVDEFQNFVTDAFESILSEARKYKLGLIIAHQYIGQLVKQNNDKVKNAVFGNVGSMLSFKIGATDAEYMAKEMAPVFSEQDLISLEGFNAIMKLNVNNIITTPFSLNTVKDFDKGDKDSAKAMTQLSRLRYGKDKYFVEQDIFDRLGGVDLSTLGS